MDKDNSKLREMGYKPELERSFSVWSLLGVCFGLTNSWFGISASLITGISSGGPMLIVYGILIVVAICLGIAVTLSELSSAFPNSGGQYYWTTVLAPKRYAGFWAYLCGAFAWAGAVFTSASVTLSIASAVVGMYALHAGPEFVIKPWMTFVAYELINIVTFVFNCWGKYLPHIGKATLYVSLFSYVVITITVLVCSRGNYQKPHFVFVEFSNGTGWSSSGIAFIVGLINPAWSFSCLDCATHMAEEVSRPEKYIPLAIMFTIAVGFATAFTYAIAMFFCIRNLDAIFQSNTGVPIMDIFHQSLQSVPGALCLEALIVLTAIGCNVASHTWQARLCWSFARDEGLPGSRYWAKVDPKLGVPFNAHLMSCVWVAVLGCLYLGSVTAFNAMVTGCILFLLFSYIVPVAALLWRGRDNIPHGPFWLGKVGLIANWVTILWTIFATVFFSFPFVKPVTGGNMNYVSVVIGVYLVYCIVYWYARGKKLFKVRSLGEDHGDLDTSSASEQESPVQGEKSYLRVVKPDTQ